MGGHLKGHEENVRKQRILGEITMEIYKNVSTDGGLDLLEATATEQAQEEAGKPF